MEEGLVRLTNVNDIKEIDKLLYQVHKIHSDLRPDLYKQGAKKYSDEELINILNNDKYKVFVVTLFNHVVGYAFTIIKEVESESLCHVKTLYIDDLCVDESIRGLHLGRTLYDYVIKYAKDNDFYNVTLNVLATNKNALEFYKHIGLVEQKIVMEKILK